MRSIRSSWFILALLAFPGVSFAMQDPLRELAVSDSQNYLNGDYSYRQGDTTYFIWMDAVNWQIHFASKAEGGLLQDHGVISGEIEYARMPTITGDGRGTLYVSFLGGGLPKGYFISSADGGASWSKPLAVTGTTLCARIAARGKTIYMAGTVQEDYSISVYRSVDGGASWSLYRNDITTPDLWYTFGLSIEIGSDGSLHLAWEDVNLVVWYVRIRGAKHALSRVRLTPDDQYQGQAPILKVAGPYVHVAWVDYRYGFFFCGDVFYSKSDDSGKTWSQALPLSDSHRVYPVTPALEIDPMNPSRVSVGWLDTRRLPLSPPRFDAFLRVSESAGRTWEPEKDLTSSNFPLDHIGAIDFAYVAGRLRVFFTQNHDEQFWKLWQLKL